MVGEILGRPAREIDRAAGIGWQILRRCDGRRRLKQFDLHQPIRGVDETHKVTRVGRIDGKILIGWRSHALDDLKVELFRLNRCRDSPGRG